MRVSASTPEPYLRSQGDLHGVGQHVNSGQNRRTAVDAETHVLRGEASGKFQGEGLRRKATGSTPMRDFLPCQEVLIRDIDGRGCAAPQELGGDCDPVGGPIGSETRSELALDSARAALHRRFVEIRTAFRFRRQPQT